MQDVCTLLWIDCFETYIVGYISPRPQLSWKKPENFSFDNMGPLKGSFTQKWKLPHDLLTIKPS